MTRFPLALAVALFAVGCSCSETDDGVDKQDDDSDGTDGTDDPTDKDDDDGDTDDSDGSGSDDSDGGDTDSDGDDTDPPPLCTAGDARCLDEVTLEACADDGSAWGTVECPSGCNASATPPACAVTTLNTWELHVFEDVPSSSPARPSYSFESNGTVAVQTENSLPSAYTYTEAVGNVRVSGRVTVNTATDDDFIGLVFGWQDAEHFYLLDWKQGTQDDEVCGLASAGVSLKKISAPAALDECVTLWASDGNDNATVLSAASLNPTPWADFTQYTFVLEYRPGDIRVDILQGSAVVASLTSSDDTWATGRFGFYNASQEQVRYEFVQFEPLP